MPWKFDIRDRMRRCHPGGKIPSEVEKYYWEVNLMIHLLDGYYYPQMHADRVSKAMQFFAGRVNAIPDDVLDNSSVKGPVASHFVAIADLFSRGDPKFTMTDLYLKTIDPSIGEFAIQHFDDIQLEMGNGKKFPNGRPRVCIPFLEWQRAGSGFPPGRVLNAFLGACGNRDLKKLIDTPRKSLGTSAQQAIDDAKNYGILITHRGPIHSKSYTVEFDNKLECNGTCQPVASGFCLAADENGTCSATSG